MTSLMIKQSADNFISMIPPLIDPERQGGANDLDLDDEFIIRHSSFRAAANVYESEVSYVLEVQAPGFNRNEIVVDLDKPGVITIRTFHEKPEPENFFARREFITEGFKRSFRLPEDILVKDICAGYNNGIIVVVFPKKAAFNDLVTIILE